MLYCKVTLKLSMIVHVNPYKHRITCGVITMLLYALILLQGCQVQLSMNGGDESPYRFSQSEMSRAATDHALAPTTLETPVSSALLPSSYVEEFSSQVDIPKTSGDETSEEDSQPIEDTVETLVRFPGVPLVQKWRERARLKDHLLGAPRLHLDELYILRSDKEDHVKLALNKPGGVCVIKGPGGSGKSTLAYHYAIENRNRNKGTLIWFVQADAQGVLLSEFQSIAQEGGVDYQTLAKEHQKGSSMHLKALVSKVYNAMDADQQAFLILDNAKESVFLEDLISLGHHNEQVKFIITTRNNAFPNYQGSQPIELVGFSPLEACIYTTERLSSDKRRFPSRERLGEDAQVLVSEVGRLPKKLELATSYIGKKTSLTVKGYIEKLQAVKRSADSSYPKVYPEVQLGLDELSAQSQRVMRYSTQLDANLIPLPLLDVLLMAPSSDNLDAILDPLEGLSLIRKVSDDDNTPIGIQIHQEVQDSCRYYRGWSEEANASEATLLGHLVDVLTAKMPWVGSNPDDSWVVARLYAPQAAQVLRGSLAVLGNTSEMAALLSRMGQYSAKVDCSYAQGLEYFEQALEMRKALYPERNHPELASSLDNVGSAYQNLGQLEKSLAYQEQALAMYQGLYGETPHPDVASSLDNVGVVYQTLGDIPKGLEYKEQALAMREKLYPDQNHPDVARSLNNVGSAYEALGKVNKGLGYKQQALAMRKKLYPDQNHPDVAGSLSNIGVTYQTLGEVQKGLTYFEQALAMRQQLYTGKPHPELASSLNNVGISYQALGETRKGLTYFEQALAMRQQLYEGEPHPYLARSLNNVGVAYQTLGEIEEALEYKEQALAMRKALYPDQDHPELASSLDNVGIAYQSLGEIKKGLEYKEQALAMRQQLYEGEPHPDVATSLNNVGVAYDALGETRKSLTYFEQAQEMRRQLYLDRPCPDVDDSSNNLSNGYETAGEHQTAKRHHKEGARISPKLDQEIADTNVDMLNRNCKPLKQLTASEDAVPLESSYDAYISYVAKASRSIATHVYDEIKKKRPDIRVFLDEKELPFGQDSSDYMVNAMNTARCGVFILSPEFAAKKWPMRELDCFLRRLGEDNPPAILPVFYRLAREECDLDESTLFDRYRFIFAREEYKLAQRVGEGKTSKKHIIQSLKQLQRFRGIEHEKEDYQLIHKTADTVSSIFPKKSARYSFRTGYSNKMTWNSLKMAAVVGGLLLAGFKLHEDFYHVQAHQVFSFFPDGYTAYYSHTGGEAYRSLLGIKSTLGETCRSLLNAQEELEGNCSNIENKR